MNTEFSVPGQLEAAYRAQINKLVLSWIPTKLRDVSDSYWLRELASVSTRKTVVQASAQVAGNMIQRVNVSNIKSWREAARVAQGSEFIHYLLQQELAGRTGVKVRQIIETNAKYISDIPFDTATQLHREITTAAQRGIRPETLAKMLRHRFPEVMESKIKLAARTQSSSASTALTRARSEELGIPCFIWETSRDGNRVRASHRHMQGVVVFWGDLPSPEVLIGQKDSLGHYAAGDAPNCRCWSRPALTLEDIYQRKNGLAKVYHNGRIEMMTKAQFARISGMESRLAA